MPKKKVTQEGRYSVPKLPDDIDELKKRCEELELENAIMKELLDVLKVDPCVSTGDLTNAENTRIVEALSDPFELKMLLGRLGLHRSS